MKNIPAYDAEVEYLENTGKNWIDVKYIPSGNDNDFYASFMPTGYVESNSVLFGSNLTSHKCYSVVRYGTNQQCSIKNGGYTPSSGAIDIPLNSKYDFTVLRDGYCKVNDFEATIDVSKNTGAETSMPVKIFSDGNTQRYTKGRIYYLKWVKGNKVVLDLIPVRKDDEGFLYDKVSHKLYGAKGTGKLIIGPDL